ncbi:hypothetical protein KL905_005151 [Ogataea polymorpha]|nr:hypothetical protein KL937_005161 [Ogataea polymorpha]KAG7897433.1 hypothetical protein KL935_005242 [Ogataea polymorpha]KAG7914867.1 hypothetical protein KL905_005151 [Ogataea polymorpha]KAG7929186.1 hypothetical protein KL934_005244 [Ogataea polymorpha]KAG7931285.1 hypothetical protein KL904_005160 [Ogataea polymorpha]
MSNESLEAAASRLEDVTIFQENAVHSKTAQAGGVVADGTGVQAGADANAIEEPQKEAPSIEAFDKFLEEYVTPFVEISDKIDPLVAEQAKLFEKALLEERKFLQAASKSAPVDASSPVFQSALAPINEVIVKAVEVKDANRTSKFFNNLNAVAEGIPALGWICVTTPVSYIPDYKDSAQFWSNRILKEYKESDPNQVKWATTFIRIFDGLKNYVKEFHTTGPSWNAQGGSFEENLAKASSSAAPAVPSPPPTPVSGAGGPPPPPPPPPASVFEAKEEQQPTGMNAVFSELNKGENITAGLKKVDKSQMTHKNPELRASSAVPAKKTVPVPPKKPASLSEKSPKEKKPPKKELVDNKWMVANFENESDIITIDGDMQQSIFIANCASSIIQIKGKVNAITLNECTKVGLVVEKAISGIDVIKSRNFEVQVTDSVPMISIDQSESGSLYLSASSLDTEVFTSSTTSLNINVPESDDMKELAVPEQFKHTVKNGKLISTIVEHAG